MKHCSVSPVCPCVKERLERADALEELARRAARWYSTHTSDPNFSSFEDDLMNEVAALIDARMLAGTYGR